MTESNKHDRESSTQPTCLPPTAEQMFHAACVFRDLCQPNYSWEQAFNTRQMMSSLG